VLIADFPDQQLFRTALTSTSAAAPMALEGMSALQTLIGVVQVAASSLNAETLMHKPIPLVDKYVNQGIFLNKSDATFSKIIIIIFPFHTWEY
jgi:glucosamine 6-phosphate synthetase-like amidotransferase/phosphosugar isomerase protein